MGPCLQRERPRLPRKPMSTGHKAALARGRAESATVRHYLEALETSKPRRGRKRTPASIDQRLGTIESQLAGADALTRLHLLQEQKDLLDERHGSTGQGHLRAREAVHQGGQGLRRAQGHHVFDVARRRGERRRCCRRPSISRARSLSAQAAGARRWPRRPGRAAAPARRPDPSRAWLARSGCGMSPTTLPRLVGDAGDGVDRAVGVVGVAQHHAVLVVQAAQRLVVARVIAREVVDRDHQFVADAAPEVSTDAVEATTQPRRLAEEAEPPVLLQRARAAGRPRSGPGSRCRCRRPGPPAAGETGHRRP